jgi:hypothetical protein
MGLRYGVLNGSDENQVKFMLLIRPVLRDTGHADHMKGGVLVMPLPLPRAQALRGTAR